MKRKLIAAAAAALVATGGGAAVAATRDWSPQEESKAVIDDVAGQLGVSSDKLTEALKNALEKRVDAAVAAGRITKEEGDALKTRIAQGDTPLVFGPGFGHKHGGPHGFFGDLSAAATYLGLTEDALRTQLESGKSLADVAQAQGKSVDGLVTALTDAAKKKLDAAVAAGNLTQAQADQIAADLKERLNDLVNRTPRVERKFEFRNGGGPPAGFAGPI
jgi:polyhydroxyalkanoate synthesis regulator phasin